MKYFAFILFIIATVNINGQTTNCDEANSYLVNAYSHVKDAYEANNISHLKYYANRSLEAFKLSKKTLSNCGCKIALDLANKSIGLLTKVEPAKTYEDGRYFVKYARNFSKESVIQIDKCSYSNSTNDNFDKTKNNTEISELQKQQLKLKQQYEALKLKEERIKLEFAQQNVKELRLKKEQLIVSYKAVIKSNIKSFNDALKVCDCSHAALKETNVAIDMSKKSIEAIKSYYINNLETLASKYLAELSLCKN